MVWRPKRSLIGESAPCEIAGDGMDQRNFQQFARGELWQDRGQPCREHRLAGPGGPFSKKVVTSGGGDFERAFGALLALDVTKIWLRTGLPWTAGRALP
jgi:hypothetical protein